MKFLLLASILFGLLKFCNNVNVSSAVNRVPSLIPRKVIFAPPDYSDIKLSPDGKWLSWIAPIGTTANVWIKAMPRGVARNLTHETGQGIFSVTWAFDNKTLLFTKDKDGDGSYVLYTLNVFTSEMRALTDSTNGTTARIFALSVRYPDKIVIGLNSRDSTYHDIYELNLVSGEKSLRFQNDYFHGFVFDNDMQIRLLHNETDEGGNNYYKFQPENGVISFYRAVDLDDVTNVYPLEFDRSGKIMYWIDVEKKGDDLGSLYEIDWKTDRKSLIYKPDKAAISGVLFHPITHRPVSVTVNYDKPNRILLDKTYQNDFRLLSSLLPTGANPWIVKYSWDFDRWIIFPLTDVNPVAYFFYDRNDPLKRIAFMFYSKKLLNYFQFAPMHPVQIEISDNLTQLCYLTLPLESDPADTGVPLKPVPTILYVHGGPWTRDSWGFDEHVQYLANRGYAVLQCNFRSSTGYGKRMTTAGNGEWGKKMQQDLTDAVRWAIDKKITDPAKVAIYGISYGGYAALAGLAFTPTLYACGIDVVGPSNLVTLMKTIPSYWKPDLNRMIKRMGGDPRTPEGQKFLAGSSPLFFADRIQRPLLIGQGANDPKVKRAESDQIVQALQNGTIPVTYVVFQNEGHGFVRPENNLAFYAIAEQFLQKCLGGRAEPLGNDISKSSKISIKTFSNTTEF